MKLFTSIALTTLFLMQVLAPGLDLSCELQKVPSLIEHYIEHDSKYGTSIFDFISMHYGDSSSDHQDDQHDENLPFHGKHHCNHAPIFVTINCSFSLNEVAFPVTNEFSTYAILINSEYTQTLFQPPRV